MLELDLAHLPAPRPLYIFQWTLKDKCPLYVFFTLFGCFWGGGGLPRGLGHNVLMQFSSLGSSRIEISETDNFDILTIQNDEISLQSMFWPLFMCFSPYLCVCVGGGGALPRGLGHNLLMQFSSLNRSKMVVPLPSSRCLAEGNRIFFLFPQLLGVPEQAAHLSQVFFKPTLYTPDSMSGHPTHLSTSV